MHHIESGAFLAHEQHAFSLRGGIGHEVGNYLRFTRSRRPLHHYRMPRFHGLHGGFLRGINGQG